MQANLWLFQSLWHVLYRNTYTLYYFFKVFVFPDHANILKQLPFNKKAPKNRNWWEHLAISFTQTCRQWRQVKEWGWLHAGRKRKNPVNQNEILGLTLPTPAERREAWGLTPLSRCCLAEQSLFSKLPSMEIELKKKNPQRLIQALFTTAGDVIQLHCHVPHAQITSKASTLHVVGKVSGPVCQLAVTIQALNASWNWRSAAQMKHLYSMMRQHWGHIIRPHVT